MSNKLGLYEQAVEWVATRVQPHFVEKTDKFIEDSIEEKAKDNPELASKIAFEVKRRGYGIGILQDFADVVVGVIVKIAGALGIAVIAESMKNNSFKMVGRVAAFTIIANNVVDIIKAPWRFMSGLIGARITAEYRQEQYEKTGIDPMGQQQIREDDPRNLKKFTATTPQQQPIQPKTLQQHALTVDNAIGMGA